MKNGRVEQFRVAANFCGNDFYVLFFAPDYGKAWFNIFPSGEKPPEGGYARDYIERMKGVKFPDFCINFDGVEYKLDGGNLTVSKVA